MPRSSSSRDFASFPVSIVQCQIALLPWLKIWPGGLRWPGPFGPSHRKGMLRPEASARETHSSIDDVAAGQKSDVANDREWMTGIGL